MGDSTEQWRATIGQWSGGRPGQCVKLQHCIAQPSDHIGYMKIRFLVLVSLLVIGCVELNPGPDHDIPAASQSVGALPKFHRRSGTAGLHGGKYEIKMAAFLFARALNKTEDFLLASNVEGAGVFDDLVFRYRLKEPDIWKTCFVQLKHKQNGGTIQRPSLTQMSGDFSLFKYFSSYCQIKREAPINRNLKRCGLFANSEFIIYTNASMEGNFVVEGDTDLISVFRSGKNTGKCITFDETVDRDVFECFEEVASCHDLIRDLDSLLERGSNVDIQINEKIKNIQISVKRKEVLEWLECLKSMPRNHDMRKLTKEIAKCDFFLFKEFLNKVKIFHRQSNKESLRPLIEEELKDACQASSSVVNSIYTKYEDGFYKWGEKSGNVVWLSKISDEWQGVERYLVPEIKEISDLELEEIADCGIRFNEQHMERLCDAIKQNTVLNIVTNSNIRNLHKLKTYQALNILGYTNSLFISLKSLKIRRKEIRKLWPCKWSGILVIDCDCDGNVTDILLDILQESLGCEQSSKIFYDNKIETLVDILQKYGQKVILISPGQHKTLASRLREKLGHIYTDYTDKCNMSDVLENSQKQILERTVNFQGIDVSLQTLVGADPPECMKRLIDSDVISILLNNEHKLCIGKQLSHLSKYYVPRVLQHHIYLKEDILKLTDKKITFAVSGLQADELKMHLPVGEKICEFVYDEIERTHSFNTVSDFSKTGVSADLENIKAYNETGKNINPEDVRYIILGKENPKIEFRELKTLCTNAHWIHVEEGSFLWRESSSNIDIIRRYIDDTKFKKCDITSVMEHIERTMLLVAEPGMGKSTLLSHMEHEIKTRKPEVWVLRINLNEHTREMENIEFEEEYIEKCKKFLWSAAHSPEQGALKLTKQIFLQALDETNKMVIIFDGFDEISPDYSHKVEMLMRVIREETASKFWVSSRFSYQKNLEDNVMKLAFTLQPFQTENQIQFLKQYWNKVMKISKQKRLRKFARKLLFLCSQNISDEDGEFTGIPLQIEMLGEVFTKEAEEYCSSGKFNVPEKFNLLDLFRKFTENKFNIYFIEKCGMDTSRQEAKRGKKTYLEKHMISALMSLFSPNEVNGLLGDRKHDLEQAKEFLSSGTAQQIGIIRDITDVKPQFIHRCFTEYFAAKWLTDNFTKCNDFISDTLFNSTYEVTRNIFDRMLAGDSEMHGAVLNSDISAVEKLLKNNTDVNISDKGDRTSLHLAASYNSPVTQKLLSFPGVDANKTDAVLKWTPLRYADRTKSWMALDILLQNGANPDDIVLTRRNFEAQEWGQRALLECASKGHRKLLEFMLNCGTDVNAVVEVPENILEKSTLLHIAAFCGQVDVLKLLLDRRADINIRNANKDNALHCAAHFGNVDVIKLLLDKGISVNVSNTQQNTPLHIAAVRGNLEATNSLVERGAALNSTNVSGLTPLMLAAYSGKLEVVRYLTETGPNINIHIALLAAVERGHLDVIDFLLANGADIDGRHDSRDISPLMLAALRQNLLLVKYLVQKGAEVNPCATEGGSSSALCAAASVGNLEITEYLLNKCADLNARDIYDMTPLAYAVLCNKTELALYLMDKCADVNIPDVQHRTPLYHTVWNNNLKCTKHLMQAGANINYQGPGGMTALSLAVELDKIHIINMLVENHASTNLRDDWGNTALHVALWKNNLSLVHYLIQRGADVNIPNKEGNTPLHWIMRRKWDFMKENLLYARMPKYFPPQTTNRKLEIVVPDLRALSFWTNEL